MIDSALEHDDGGLVPTDFAALWRLARRLQACDSLAGAEAEAAEAAARAAGSPALVRAIEATVAPALAGLRDRELLADLVIRDPLTGLFNRRYLDGELPRLVSCAARRNASLAVALVDLDRFRECNDRHGHRAGDLVLQWLALHLHGFRRADDLPCRYGGDEFLLVMPDATIAEAVVLLEPFRRRVAEAVIHHDGRRLQPVTVSIGIASCPEDVTTPETLVDAADAAMYRAKRSGGDGICVACDVAAGGPVSDGRRTSGRRDPHGDRQDRPRGRMGRGFLRRGKLRKRGSRPTLLRRAAYSLRGHGGQ